MGRKLGVCPLGRGSWAPSNTMWPGPKPTCMPSFFLIHPTVWPQYTKVTDRTDRQTDRQDNGLIAQGEPFTNGRPKIALLHLQVTNARFALESPLFYGIHFSLASPQVDVSEFVNWRARMSNQNDATHRCDRRRRIKHTTRKQSSTRCHTTISYV